MLRHNLRADILLVKVHTDLRTAETVGQLLVNHSLPELLLMTLSSDSRGSG